MVSELQSGAKYYLDLIDDEIAYTCWRHFTEQHNEPELSNQMMERRSTVIQDYL